MHSNLAAEDVGAGEGVPLLLPRVEVRRRTVEVLEEHERLARIEPDKEELRIVDSPAGLQTAGVEP